MEVIKKSGCSLAKYILQGYFEMHELKATSV